jgi:hypothetical protein
VFKCTQNNFIACLHEFHGKIKNFLDKHVLFSSVHHLSTVRVIEQARVV